MRPIVFWFIGAVLAFVIVASIISTLQALLLKAVAGGIPQ